jgi:hypothetical protein
LIAGKLNKTRDHFLMSKNKKLLFCYAGVMSVYPPILPHPIVGNDKSQRNRMSNSTQVRKDNSEDAGEQMNA